MKAIISLLSGQIAALPVLAGTLATFVLYRILGKHIDEIYTKLRKGKSQDALISSLREEIIDEKHRADEAREMAERHIRLARKWHWQWIESQRELAKVKLDLELAQAAEDNHRSAREPRCMNCPVPDWVDNLAVQTHTKLSR